MTNAPQMYCSQQRQEHLGHFRSQVNRPSPSPESGNEWKAFCPVAQLTIAKECFWLFSSLLWSRFFLNAREGKTIPLSPVSGRRRRIISFCCFCLGTVYYALWDTILHYPTPRVATHTHPFSGGEIIPRYAAGAPLKASRWSPGEGNLSSFSVGESLFSSLEALKAQCWYT